MGRDVIVKAVRVPDAAPGAAPRYYWSLFVNTERLIDCSTRKDAEKCARALARALGVRAWTAEEPWIP